MPWKIFIFLCLVSLLESMVAQPPLVDDPVKEAEFYAETKQVNQFFRRFNCEESLRGDRYYDKDSLYRDPVMRVKYLQELFDKENQYLTSDLKNKFIQDITNRENPTFLNFHGGNFFAEVRVDFLYRGRKKEVILFMKLQEQPVGSKWVFDQVYFETYDKVMNFDALPRDSFLHPLSHELDFMNLNKLFSNETELGPFVSRDHKVDHLSLFVSDFKKGFFRFKTVTEVRFHFFQAKDWYFELSEFNRSGYNSGWLISQLTQIPDERKPILKQFIYNYYQ